MFTNQTNLNDKIVFITGSSAGLGKDIAYEAAKKGAIVVVAARRKDLLSEVKEQCMSYSGKDAYAYALDVADPDQIQEVIEQIHKEAGPIDILVNNAGFGYFQDVLHFDLSIAEKMFRVNVLGLMYVTQLVAIEMAERRQGHIINIGSQAGKIATSKSAVYSASKFAVVGYSNALRLEMKPLNISVTTVNPGPIETNFFDLADTTGEYLTKVGKMVLNSEAVAKKIVGLMGTSRRELNIPKMMEIAGRFYTLFPHAGDYLAGTLFKTK